MNFPIIQQHQDSQKAVSARELYDFLQPTERFASWFERQLQYGFVVNQDYLGCEVFNTLARQSLQDYFISVDMAKEISMIQRSDKGKQARQYFIECERRSNQPVPIFQIPQTLGEALQLAADQAKQLELAAPKVHFYDTVAERDNLMTVTQVATKLGMSAQALNKRLTALGAYDGRIKRCKTFTSEFVAKGYGEMKVGSTGHDQGLITQAGQAWIIELFSYKELA